MTTIDDIHYLKEHSMKESYMFFVDSKNRDKEKWETPQEYVVTFGTPFRNVYSLEILDASIPRTQYNIDTHNNTLVYKLDKEYSDAEFDEGGYEQIEIPIGDYNEESLINVINEKFTEKGVNVIIQNVSERADERSTFVFKSNVEFRLDMQVSTMATVLGFDMPTQDDHNGVLYEKAPQYTKAVVHNGSAYERLKYSRRMVYGSLPVQGSGQIFYLYRSLILASNEDTVLFDPSQHIRFHFRVSSEHNYRRFQRLRLKVRLNANVDEGASVAQYFVYSNVKYNTVYAEADYVQQFRGVLKYEQDRDAFSNDFSGYLVADVNEGEQYAKPIESEWYSGSNSGLYFTEGEYVMFFQTSHNFQVYLAESNGDDYVSTYREYFPTPTPTVTHTIGTPTYTMSDTVTNTIGTPTPTISETAITPTVTAPTPTDTITMTHTVTESPTVTHTMSGTITMDVQTPTDTVTVGTPTVTMTQTSTGTVTHTNTAPSPTVTITETLPYPENNELLPLGSNEDKFEKRIINGVFMVPAIDIELGEPGNKIEAPGIYSLIGDRYVILRCPEIEQHMYRSRSYERHTMGLAKFKLAAEGYDDTRMDFTNLPPREFHPIGKLTHMTLRFERPDGSLYNFRGVNHTITMVVRYYEPKQTMPFTNYTLNPEYNPDFFKYIQDQESESEEEDD